MPGSNLTRDEAAERARILSVDSYEVEVDLRSAMDSTAPTFASTTVIRFASSEQGASTFVDLVAPAVRRVVLNGRELDPATIFADHRIALDDLAATNELRIEADCAYMNTGEGLHRFFDPADGNTYLYTQFEVPDARRMFATFEQPDLKATFALTVIAPEGWQVISNSPTPAPQPIGDGLGRWVFDPTPRISTYLTALVAGPYHVVQDSYSGRNAEIPMAVYCRPTLAEYLDADEILDVTKKGFAFFEDEFDYPYPFAKYDQLFVPEYNMGAMENPGAVTIRDEYVFRSRTIDAAYEGRAVTILHELAHMWFGDLVTMKWWDDLWLNESFATYASQLALAERTRWTHGWTTFANTDKTWAYRQDQLPTTHPISADIGDLDDVKANFDGITYAKGASVLKQLVAWVGREEFFAGLRHYFKAFEWRNATLADLLNALEATSGRDLRAWSREWLETAGVNTLRPSFSLQDGAYQDFAVVQTAAPAYPTLRPHRVAIGLYDLVGSELVRRTRLELDIVGERTEVPELTGVAQPDLVLLNDDDLTFAKVRLDERSLETLIGHIGAFTDPLPRAVCWTAAWDMCRDAELPSKKYVSLVLGGIGAESDITLFQHLLRTGVSAVENYSNPTRRLRARLDWANGLLPLVSSAAPGSDQQLALVRAFATAAVTPEHGSVLAELLAGTRSYPELAVDTELRWHLVQQLARLGIAGDAEIDAELERDDTIKGREAAAQARASRPYASSKEQAWQDMVDRDDIPNQTHANIIRGFWQPGQEELLAPYVSRYLDAAGWVWGSKGQEMAYGILVGLFPRLVATEETIQTVNAWLEATDPEPIVRRLVSEGVADIERALKAQAIDV